MIVFENPGVLPSETFLIMGISAKENSNPIGYFGTGLKYAIAICSRKCWKLSIQPGDGTSLPLSTKEFSFRNKTFYRLLLGNHLLPFTSNLGERWPAWAVLRELEANARDEGGSSRHCTEEPIPEKGVVRIIVTSKEFEDIWHRRSEYFISKTPLYETEEARVFSSPSTKLFYRGVCVKEDLNFCMTYDILSSLKLSEDRELISNWRPFWVIKEFWVRKCKDENLISEFLKKMGKESTEAEYCQWGSTAAWSETFKSVAYDLYEKNQLPFNCVYKSVLRDYTPANEPIETKDQREDIEKAKKILYRFNIPVHSNVRVEPLPKNVLGLYCPNADKISIDPEVFERGFTFLLEVLLEEAIHALYNYPDCSLEMQRILTQKTAYCMKKICNLEEGTQEELASPIIEEIPF